MKFLVLVLLACTPALSHDTSDPKKMEIMEKMIAAATPGEPHKILASMAGKWNYSSKYWESADAKPHEAKGTSVTKMILGGRFLQHELKGKFGTMPFEGFGLTGYDNIKGEYNTMWIDSMGTAMLTGKGRFDAATKTLADSGQFSCPLSPSKEQDYRAEWKIVDRDNMVYSLYSAGMNVGGPAFKNIEMKFKRRK